MERLDQQKRMIIATALTIVVMIVFARFFGPGEQTTSGNGGPDAGGAAVAQNGAAGGVANSTSDRLDGGVASVADAGAAIPSTPPVAEQVPEKNIEFKSDAQELTFSNRGGGISRAIIKNGDKWPEYKFFSREKGPDDKPKAENIVQIQPGMSLAGATEVKGEIAAPINASYEVEQAENLLTMRYAGQGVGVEKRFQLNPKGYEFRMDVKVTNNAAEPKKAALVVSYPAWVNPATEESGGIFSPGVEITQAFCRHGNSNDTSEKKNSNKSFAGPVKFVGFNERYFIGAIFPRFKDGTTTSCVLSEDQQGHKDARIEVDLGSIPPGQSVTKEFGFYMGPKAFSELNRVSQQNATGGGLTPIGDENFGSGIGVDPELGQSVDFGMWAFICRILLAVLKFFQKVVVNWGVAIVLLTVLVKVLLFPLNHKQMASMEEMKRLQPQIDALQKKYGKDKEKLNLERMKLFQENKINPLAGCLPILVQLPVWFALYQTLQASFELYREPLAFWMKDLTVHDPYYILPLVMGVTTFISSKLQPPMGDPMQAKMMLYMMPIMFTFMMLKLPSGLALYMLTNNLLTIAQQKILQRKFAKSHPAPIQAQAQKKK